MKYAIKSFSDPLISILYLGTNQTLERNTNNRNIDLPDSYMMGFDLFLILNPNILLNLNTEHSYQTSMKEDSIKVNNSTILSTIGFGVTYNMSENNAFTINSSVGTSTNAPESRLTFSLNSANKLIFKINKIVRICAIKKRLIYSLEYLYLSPH